MRYYGNASTPAIREAMTAGLIGCIVTPAEGRLPPAGAAWCADNGKFGKGYPGDDRFLAWLARLGGRAESCAFAVVPDAPFDAAGTLALYPRLAPAVRELGYRAALAGQNGMEDMAVPWDDVDVVCLGGDTAWKTGLGGAELARQARAHGKPVHMLRVNSYKRASYAAGLGCVSADGTHLARVPDEGLGEVLRWLAALDRAGVQGIIA